MQSLRYGLKCIGVLVQSGEKSCERDENVLKEEFAVT